MKFNAKTLDGKLTREQVKDIAKLDLRFPPKTFRDQNDADVWLSHNSETAALCVTFTTADGCSHWRVGVWS